MTASATDRGSGTLWLVGVVLAVLLLAGSVVVVGTAVVARHRAAVAADFGALAGARYAADGARVACAQAGRVIVENHGELLACRVDGLDVIVTVRVNGPRGFGPAEASARAGPIRAPRASW